MFSAANCSRWATEIGEESEPSDAETISSQEEEEDDEDEECGSWEDEEEGTELKLFQLSYFESFNEYRAFQLSVCE